MSEPVVVHEEVITQIRQAMADAGVNQEELARRLGRSQPWLSRVLAGRRELKVRDAEAIAHALGVDLRIDLNGQQS